MIQDLTEMIDYAEANARATYHRYGLSYQGIDRSWVEDMRQASLLRHLESGVSMPVSCWRGVHEQIRLAIYGGENKRYNRPTSVPLDEMMPEDGRCVEEQVEALRLIDRLDSGSVAHEYFVKDKTLREIGDSCGLTAARISQLCRDWISEVS
ncbi:MAG: hypothetical protein MN733_07695 [Nitrososphaera sp.]|nr:hypothetical protein [Nitrososphaera sp.]